MTSFCCVSILLWSSHTQYLPHSIELHERSNEQANGNRSVETGDDIDINRTGITEFEIGPVDECVHLLLITWCHIRIHK